MGSKTHIALYASVLGALIFALPAFAYADSVVIENSVSVSAQTGGNSASGGSSSGASGADGSAGGVVEGEASISVSSQTSVNGVVVESIEEEKTGTSEAHFEQTVIHQDGETSIESAVTVSPATEDEEVAEREEAEDGARVHLEETQGREEDTEKSSLFSVIINFFEYVFSIFRA